MNYAREKLGQAIYELTVGEGDIKSRLRKAFRCMIALSEKDFPQKLRKDWQSIKNRLTKRESRYKGTQFDEGSFEATIFGMHKKTAVKIAADLVELNDRLEDAVDDPS